MRLKDSEILFALNILSTNGQKLCRTEFVETEVNVEEIWILIFMKKKN